MEIIRLPVGEQASTDADCLRIEEQPDAGYKLTASAICIGADDGESVSIVGGPTFADAAKPRLPGSPGRRTWGSNDYSSAPARWTGRCSCSRSTSLLRLFGRPRGEIVNGHCGRMRFARSRHLAQDACWCSPVLSAASSAIAEAFRVRLAPALPRRTR